MLVPALILFLSCAGGSDGRKQFIDEVYAALPHADDASLRAAIEKAPYRALPLVQDLLHQAASPGADPYIFEAAKRIASAAEHRAALESVERFQAFDETLRSKRFAFENLFAVALEAKNREEIEPALETLAAALELEEPFLEARVRRLLGEIEGMRGNTDAAREYLFDTMALDGSLGCRVQLGWDYTLLGDLDFRNGRYISALEWYGKALEIAEVAGESLLEGILQANRGALFSYLGQYEEAERSLSSALSMARRIGDGIREAYVLSAQGALESGRGDYQRSLKIFHEARRAWHLAGDAASEGKTLVSMAGVLSEAGQTTEAREAIEEALSLFREDDETERARALVMLGLIHLDASGPLEALPPLERGRTLLENAGDRAGTADALQHMGAAHVRLHKEEEAERLFSEALEIRHDLGDRYGATVSAVSLGDALWKQGKQSEAAYVRALEAARELNLPELLWRARFGLGRTLQAQGRTEEALDQYRDAIVEVEGIRRLLLAPSLRQRYLGDKLELFRRYSGLLAGQGRVSEAFQQAQAAKARTLLELFAYRPLSLPAENASLRAVQESEARLQLLEIRLTEACKRPDATALRQELEGQVLEARAEHGRARLALALDAPRFAGLSGLGSPPSLSEVQRKLEDRTVLLEYLVGEEESGVFWVKNKEAGFLPLPVSAREIDPWVQRILAPMERLESGAIDAANLHFDVKAARALYDALIAPLRGAIGSCDTLLIVPDGALRKLPFSLLVSRWVKRPVDPRTLFAQYRGCTFLIEEFFVGLLPASGLLLADRDEPERKGALILADPGSGALPGAEKEANAVAQCFEGDVTRFIGNVAAEYRIKSENLSVPYLHLACHAELNDEKPPYSRLALAPGLGEDGWLHAYEIERLSLNGSCVILSACKTMGSAGRGEGLLGLSRAFLIAGARSVTATAWEVDDEATAFLMHRFYEGIAEGRIPIEALRLAQLALIKSEGRPGVCQAHPFFWAGFLYTGPR